MNIGDDIFDALKGLVANRVYPDTLPQPPAVPTWPAIRYTIVSGENFETINDDGDEETDDIRFQLDVYAETSRARHVLWRLVRAAMKTLDPPVTLQGVPADQYEPAYKVRVRTADYVVHGSSASGNSPP